MSNNSSLYPNTIHFNQSYIDYQFDWINFSVPLAVVPWIYIIPSFIIICKIFRIYLKSSETKLETDVNRHVFLAISLSQFACFASFFFDYFMTRLPATGVFTSYCASIHPNHWLKVILFLALYTNYLSLAFPILLPLIRLVIVMYPKSHRKINSNLIRVIVPLLAAYPICFTFYLIPALGVCKSYEYPYPFGAVWIYYTNSWFGLRNSYFNLYSIFFWLVISVIINLVLLFKVNKAKSQIVQTAGGSYKAEFSITVTTLAIILFYLLNGVFVLFYIFAYGANSFTSYTVILRPFGNDMQTCVISWVFFLTHPVFKRKTIYPSSTIEIFHSHSH
ncbi:hypothetical protein CRE_01340 [Caenorhabditis remanei]|uniref:Uncharacterized protein n=1 Tax=Caenorhabditis remanei TaxID=31234 RepID=E3ND77_CAERE|nr:hypothetical protein CRE_01340 [Caenorhabditis remanei]